MGLIVKPSTFSAGGTIVASEHNNNYDTVYNEFNGNIDNANIKASAAILGSKLSLAIPGAIGGTTPSGGSFTNLGLTSVTLASATNLTMTGTPLITFYDQGIMTFPRQSHCRVYLSANQTIANNSATHLQLNAQTYDIQNEFDTSTNYKFTATKAGYYLVTANVKVKGVAADKVVQAQIYKNGSAHSVNWQQSSHVEDQGASCSDIISLAATDTIELFAYQNSGGDRNAEGDSKANFLSIHKIS